METKILVKDRIMEFMAKYSIYVITVLFIIICAFLNDKFLTGSNLSNILRQICVYALLAFAESILIISGNIDLTAGATVALIGCVSVYAYVWSGSMAFAVAVAVAGGAAVNLVSGLFTVMFNIPSFVATLGMMNVARGFAYVITDGSNITKTGENFTLLGQGYIAGIPISIIVMIICAFLLWLLLDRTKLGRSFYAIGGNKDAAKACGISIKKNTVLAFVLSGCFVGLAGIMYASRCNGGMPAAANGYECTGIAAAVIGGIGFNGGTGSAWGTIVGALVLGVISNILNLLGIDSYIQSIVYGFLIIAAVGLDTLTRTKRVSR